MNLFTWSWIFLVIYVGGMLIIGFLAGRQVSDADSFATARGSYGPGFLSFAFAATTASGATFLGGPGLAYQYGFAAIWSAMYPLGIYLGLLICLRLVSSAGNRFANRSIPEFLGDRYGSEGIRILVSIFSLLLFFYLAGQLVSGLVMFETMLGLSQGSALIFTTVVLLIYVTIGGAHADILTDGVQGFIMLLLAIVVVAMFALGFGVVGGFDGMVDKLEALDPNTVTVLNEESPLFHGWWGTLAWTIALIPFGLLPHIGNKLWALKSSSDRLKFVRYAFCVSAVMALMGLGGILARAVLGDTLFDDGMNPNQALPMLFIELFPTWLAALIGVGILAAIMSTADGLVVSSSQIIANDIYRRSIAPRLHSHLDEKALDTRVLLISRWSTVIILLSCMALAWALIDENIAIIIMMGSGGLIAAFAGPLVMGAVWKGVTRSGAYAGLTSGIIAFSIFHSGILNPEWFSAVPALHSAVSWLAREAPNPYSCALMGEIVSVFVTWLVSILTSPLPQEHIEDFFDSDQKMSAN